MKAQEILKHQEAYIDQGLDPRTGEPLEYYYFMLEKLIIAKSPTKNIYYYTQVRLLVVFKLFINTVFNSLQIIFFGILHWILISYFQLLIKINKGNVTRYLKKLNPKKDGRKQTKGDRD